MVVVGAVGVIGRIPKNHVLEKHDAIILPSFSAGFHAVAAVRRRVLSSRTCWPPSALALRRELEWRRCRSLLTATFSRACVAVVSLESVARRRALCPPSGTRHAPRACWRHRRDIVCRPRKNFRPRRNGRSEGWCGNRTASRFTRLCVRGTFEPSSSSSAFRYFSALCWQ